MDHRTKRADTQEPVEEPSSMDSTRLRNRQRMREEDDPFQEESYIGIQTSQLLDSGPMTITSAPRHAPVQFANVDPWARINECTPEQIEKLAQILELRGAQPRQVKMRQACFEAAEIRPGMRVLELGAGTGVVTRQLAVMVGRKGRVVGLDPSGPMLDYARRHVSPGAPIEYVVGDAYDLQFAPGSFDATMAVTLFAHLGEARKVVQEMLRVTRSGGRIMLLDQDYQTLVFEHSNKPLTRRILLHGSDYNVMDPWCGRSLPGHLVEAGLLNVQCWPFVYAERDSQSYLITIAERFVTLAVTQEAITEEEGRVWLDELYMRAVEGTFYGSLNYYFAFGEVR